MRRAGRALVVLGVGATLALPAQAGGRPGFPVGPRVPHGIETVVQPDVLSAAAFADPPMWARPQAYWLPDRSQTLAESVRQLKLFKAAGLGGVTLEPGGPQGGVDTAGPSIDVPGWPMPQLSDAWFTYLDGVLDEAEKLGMTMYLPDVAFTPSGGARGRVAEPAKGGDPSLGWTTLDEVVPGQVYRQNTRPYWIDPLNPAAVARYIALDYDEHRRHLGKHFGRGLQAMWSDEVSFSPTVSPNSFRYPAPRFPEIPWSASFPAYFTKRWGYQLTPALLDKVFAHDPTDPVGRRVGHDYWDAVSARFADVYYGTLSRWSTSHGVGFIGQLLAEETLDSHFVTEGSYFRAAAQPTITSTDLISGNLDVPGTPFCDGQSCYGLTLKLISSAAHLFDRNRVHVEFLDLDHAEVKDRPSMFRAMVDHAVARGVNSFAPHSYDYTGGGYSYGNPLFPVQRPLNDYIGRLSYLFSNGRSRPDLALGYAPEAFWAGDTWDTDVESLTAGVLGSAQYQYDHVPVELFADPALRIGDGSFSYRTQTYRGLVMADWHVASLPVVRRIADFVRRGGTLAVVGRAPAWESRGDDRGLGAAVRDLMGFDPAAPPTTVTTRDVGKGHVVWVPGDFTADVSNLTPARVAPLAPMVSALRRWVPPRIQLSGDRTLPSGLSATETYPYRRAGSDVYLVTNFPSWRSKGTVAPPGSYAWAFESAPTTVTLSVPATGVPELWDAETGKVTRVWTYDVTADGRLRVPLDLPAFGSRVLRLNPRVDPRTAPHVVATDLRDVVVRDDGRVTGYVPVGLRGAATATVCVGSRCRRLSVARPPVARVRSYSGAVYDVTWGDGSVTKRSAGTWTEASTAPFDPPRTPWYSDGGTYRAGLDLPAAGQGRVLLDLGAVGDAGTITVNGHALGTRLFPPYSVDVSDVARSGTDRLEVLVRVSRAGGFPNDSRWPSGLLGPVTARREPLVVLG